MAVNRTQASLMKDQFFDEFKYEHFKDDDGKWQTRKHVIRHRKIRMMDKVNRVVVVGKRVFQDTVRNVFHVPDKGMYIGRYYIGAGKTVTVKSTDCYKWEIVESVKA